MITNEELQNILNHYKDGKLSDELLIQVFYKLAEHLYRHKPYELNGSKEDIFRDTAKLCLSKVSRFDHTRGKAFNFLCTIIGCFLIQHRRRKCFLKNS